MSGSVPVPVPPAPAPAATAAAETWLQAGVAALQANRLPESAALFRAVVALTPDVPGPYANLAIVLRRQNQPQEALRLLQQALHLAPETGVLHFNRGNLLRDHGFWAEAAHSYQNAALRMPGQIPPLEALAECLRALGQEDVALSVKSQIILIEAGLADALYSVDHALHRKDAIATAIRRLQELLVRRPDHRDVRFQLAGLLQLLERESEAVVVYRDLLKADPTHVNALCNLGAALKKLGQLDAAFAVYLRAVVLQPDNAEVLFNLGNGFQARGRLLEAIAAFRQALKVRPDFQGADANLLAALNYAASLPRAEILGEHQRFAARHAAPLEARPLFRPDTPHDRSPERRLRIGYVSPDLWRHSCAYFLLSYWPYHDRQQAVEVFVYADVKRPDSFTRRLRSHADHWHNSVDDSDAALAARIRADAIDILIDLNGHFAGTRLLAFARKPAPVQITWLGYPNTTGLASMDYRLVDAVTDPPGDADPFHSETLIRLPTPFLCYSPVPEAPAVTASPPCSRGAPLTFGSFNNTAKVTTEVIAVWAALLHRIPGSRLLLKSRSLDDPGTRDRFAAAFREHGLGAGRVELLPWSLLSQDHLRTYEQVDIALDPFPYNGTTTTCEALWMGVPVVSVTGDRHAGRVGMSLLTALGHPEWIAPSTAAMIPQVAALADNREHLAALRAALRPQMAASPLCDGPGFARSFETVCRTLWQRWCTGQSPTPLPGIRAPSA